MCACVKETDRTYRLTEWKVCPWSLIIVKSIDAHTHMCWVHIFPCQMNYSRTWDVFFCCLMWCVMEFPAIWRLAQPRRHDVRMETAGYEDTESLVCGLRFSHWRTILNASAVSNTFESYWCAWAPVSFCRGHTGQRSADQKFSLSGNHWINKSVFLFICLTFVDVLIHTLQP